MTEALTTTPDRPKPKRNGKATARRMLLCWSGYMLAVHFGCSRRNVDQLTAQGVIERRCNGRFDQDFSRLKYMTHLRSEHRRSPRAAADAKHAEAKTELL
jgi:hypothetical protein